MVREIIGFLGLNPRRREDRHDIEELWDVVHKTARRIALYQLEREIENIKIHYSDSQNWRLENGLIKVRTHMCWVELN